MQPNEITVLRDYIRRRIKLAYLSRKKQNPRSQDESQQHGSKNDQGTGPTKAIIHEL